MAERQKELKSLLMRVKEENEKAGFPIVRKLKIMVSSPITSRQIEGKKLEAVADFIFLGSKITAHYDCSDKIRRHLLLGRKAMTNPYNILKRREITLLTEVHIVKAIFSPMAMYRCDSWTIKAEPKALMLLNCGAREDS